MLHLPFRHGGDGVKDKTRLSIPDAFLCRLPAIVQVNAATEIAEIVVSFLPCCLRANVPLIVDSGLDPEFYFSAIGGKIQVYR